ncbi:MAG: ABC transporter permease [Betaproteobacteria bacterium]|nr:ABC transporter permease [Betaproteobacteria bacterium]NCW25415.1 ABC transporter permease [Betaproteobacteria bacterium]NCW80267.1 ABC transporter permease [Betaproteobacteria bacterium]
MTPASYQGRSVWSLALERFLADRVAVISAAIVVMGLLTVLASALDLVASQWSQELAVGHAPPHWFAHDESSSDGQAKVRGATTRPIATAGTSNNAPTPCDVLDPIESEMRQVGGYSSSQAKLTPSAADVQDPIANELSLASKKLAQHRTIPMAERAPSAAWGADKWGRDVLDKTIKAAETSILVGLCAALIATVIGSLLGAFSGWYGGWVDDLSNWIYNVLNAIPGILLILAIAAVLDSKGVLSIVIILGVTGWTGVYRLVRGEYLKHRDRDYVRAAYAIGASPLRRMFIHVLPNVSHVILVQFSLLTVACIKAEVILSFLGFGVPVDGVSWGTMLTEAQNDLLLGIWWQLAAATLAMGLFVTALSLLTDALRDALDPKLTH